MKWRKMTFGECENCGDDCIDVCDGRPDHTNLYDDGSEVRCTSCGHWGQIVCDAEAPADIDWLGCCQCKTYAKRIEELEDVAYPAFNFFKSVWEKIQSAKKIPCGGFRGQIDGSEIYECRVRFTGHEIGEYDQAHYALSNSMEELKEKP